jgi:peptide subunit release factor RF-3
MMNELLTWNLLLICILFSSFLAQLMLLDGAKGLEPQTRKLFEVCRMRKLPLFTFVNKMDRPALTPYEIMDQIEGTLHITISCFLFVNVNEIY